MFWLKIMGFSNARRSADQTASSTRFKGIPRLEQGAGRLPKR